MESQEIARDQEALGKLVNTWGRDHYDLSMNDHAIVESLKKFCLETGEDCPIDDLAALIVLADLTGDLELCVELGWPVLVMNQAGQWDIVVVPPGGQVGRDVPAVSTS